MTKSKGIKRPDWRWTEEQDALLRARYSNTKKDDLARLIGCTPNQVTKQGARLNLKTNLGAVLKGRARSTDAIEKFKASMLRAKVERHAKARIYEEKPCGCCGINKPLIEFKLMPKRPDGHTANCRDCLNKRATELRNPDAEKARYHKNKGKHYEKRRQYSATNANAIAEKLRAWRERNPTKHQANKKKYAAHRVASCQSGYVRALLARGISVYIGEIPQGLVNAKREHLKLVRELNKGNS